MDVAVGGKGVAVGPVAVGVGVGEGGRGVAVGGTGVAVGVKDGVAVGPIWINAPELTQFVSFIPPDSVPLKPVPLLSISASPEPVFIL